jgi:hypothetical protein
MLPPEEKKSQENELWHSCCLTFDKDAVIYFTQIFILGSLLCYSTILMAQAQTCEDKKNWMSIITLVLGLICPNPKMRVNKS